MGRGPSKKGARILIADRQVLLREGLKSILEKVHGFSIVGMCEDAPETQRLVKRLKPDVLLLDYSGPKFLAAEVLRRLGSETEKICPIVLAVEIDGEQVDELFRLGARGVILKDSAASHLAQCIHSVMAGQYCLGQKTAGDRQQLALIAAEMDQKKKPPANFGLTPREMEIMANIVAGKSNRELAESFFISQQTVKHHLTNIFDKVGVYNRLELALFAIHHQLIRKG